MYTGIILSFQPLTVTQIKKVQSLIQESNDRCAAEMKECETVRHQHLVQIGNTLHPRVPISNDEVSVCVCVCVKHGKKCALYLSRQDFVELMPAFLSLVHWR